MPALGRRDAPTGRAAAAHGGDDLAVHLLLGGHRRRCGRDAAVLVGVRCFCPQHDREHGLGADEARQAAQHPDAEGEPRRLEIDDSRLAQPLGPVGGVALLRFGESEEDRPAVLVGVIGQRPIQRGTAQFVGPHLAELGHLGVERGSAARHTGKVLPDRWAHDYV